MKKLSNNTSGSLKEKFEGLEEVPSLRSWRHLEAELATINKGIAKKRKRRRAAVYMATASIVVLLFMIGTLDFDQNSNYQPRTAQDFNTSIKSEHDNWKLSRSNQSTTGDIIAQYPQANINTNAEGQNTMDDGSQAKATISVQSDVSELSKLKVAYGPVPTERIELKPEHLDKKQQRARLSHKWRINFSGGQDISRNALAPRSAAAFVNGNGTGRPLQSWSFEPYTHLLPVVISAGVERRLTRRISAHVNMDYQMMRAVADAPYSVNNRTAVKKGRLNQFGLAIGLTGEVIRTKRVSAFIGVETWAAHATNSYTEIIQLNGNNREASISEVQLTPSSILSVRATAGLKYRLTEKISLTGSALGTKPIHNYMNELNVYNNGEKYIPGVRFGVSVAI